MLGLRILCILAKIEKGSPKNKVFLGKRRSDGMYTRKFYPKNQVGF
jgi:hypothetical protein